jgi:hypothetical protein
MYGSVLVDGFNLVLNEQGQFIYDKLHHDPMAMRAAARSCEQRAAAFGFVSHNDNWGADWTAHHHAMTLSDGGYAVIKGQQLAATIQPVLYQILRNANPAVPEPLAEGLSTSLAPELGHDLSETAVDLMIKRRDDPAIGARMLLAARCRSSSIPVLLCDAYAPILATTFQIPMEEARGFLTAVEADYRNQTIQYGEWFLLPESRTIHALAQMNAATAEGYLEYFAALNGFPTDVTVTPSAAETFIRAAINAVQGDYRHELNATLTYLCRQMQHRGIQTCRPFGKEGDEVVNSSAAPTDFSLGENYPNPFNPTTEIRFQIPEFSKVTLKIYDLLGKEVATLVNETKPAGDYTVQWNASGFASGTYIARLTTPNGVFTRRMALIK